MGTGNRAIGSSIAISFALAAALCLAPRPGLGQEPAPQPKEAAPEPKVQSRRYALSVTVVTTKEPGEPESLVKEATVTVFAPDHQQAKRTADGRTSFRFETEGKTVTLRVVADKMNPYQRPVELGGVEIQHKVVLTKSQ